MLVFGYFAWLWLAGPHRYAGLLDMILFFLACVTALTAVLCSLWAVLDNREKKGGFNLTVVLSIPGFLLLAAAVYILVMIFILAPRTTP